MRFYTFLIVLASQVPSLEAQQPSGTAAHVPGTQVQTMWTATRSVPPDLAVALFEFSARGTTLGGAAHAASAIGEAIRRAVVKSGIPSDSILGRGSISYVWDHTNPMEIRPNPEFKRYDTTYVFRDMIVVRIRDMKRVDPVLEAALGAGAQKLVSLQFTGGRVQQAAQEALTEATREARRNAELMAAAAGSKLGRVLDLATAKSGSSDSFYELRPTNVAIGTSGSGPVLRAKPPDTELRVSVYGLWELVPVGDPAPR